MLSSKSPSSDLEEGEIADDSNDDIDSDDDQNTANTNFLSTGAAAEATATATSNNSNGTSPAPAVGLNSATNGALNEQPQKKKRKVVRKVRRRVRVKKKTVSRKDGFMDNNGVGSSTTPLLATGANAAPILGICPTTSTTANPLPTTTTSATATVTTTATQLGSSNQNWNQTTTTHEIAQTIDLNGPTPDQLWEQQVLMLQELQKQQHERILKAATTDEDLRSLLRPPIISQHPVPSTLLPCMQQQLQLQQDLLQQSLSTDKNNIQQSQHQHTPLQQLLPKHPEQQQNIQQTQPNQSQQQANLTVAELHTNPGSPDDDSGKSSYEAISKMLTLLRNSANDVNDTTDQENKTISDNLDESQHSGGESSSASSIKNSKGKTIEYSLIPILVDGIDYTRYKLLSQYEPKFRLDPRLNQQT